MNPEHVLRVIALMVGFTGRGNASGHEAFARAIVQATDNAEEQRLLTVVAFGENWYHTTSYPPFGLTLLVQTNPAWCWGNHLMPTSRREWHRPGCRILSVEEGARISLIQLRYVRRVRCAPRARDEDVLARYGWGGACRANRLTTARMNRARQLTADWR